MDKYTVKVHPVDSRGNRAHVYWPERPGMNSLMVSLGRSGVGFSRYVYAVYAAQQWAKRDEEKYGPHHSS